VDYTRRVASTTDIKNGVVLRIDGNLWQVTDFQHVKPGKGGAFVRTKMKNVLTGKVVDKTYNAGAKIETAVVDRSDYQFSYKDGDDFVFMDTTTWDQVHINADIVGDQADFLLEGTDVVIASNDGTPLYVDLPASVVLEITHTEPGLQGDRSTGGTKPATLETGREIQVPLFLTEGTKVKVDTRTGEYLSRVND
jgi:elongation factor P